MCLQTYLVAMVLDYIISFSIRKNVLRHGTVFWNIHSLKHNNQQTRFVFDGPIRLGAWYIRISQRRCRKSRVRWSPVPSTEQRLLCSAFFGPTSWTSRSATRRLADSDTSWRSRTRRICQTIRSATTFASAHNVQSISVNQPTYQKHLLGATWQSSASTRTKENI